MKTAFSLVELSIVLVIIGLLVGGILTGKSLIHASELRSVTSDYSRYVAAHHAFRDKYFAIPGDISNATAFWGKDATNCNANTGTAATPGTCNGNGDGIVLSNSCNEYHRYWQHLALAGLIEGSYTGLSNLGAVCGWGTVPGLNRPMSKIAGATWTALDGSSGFAAASGYVLDYGTNVLEFGNPIVWTGAIGPPEMPMLTPEDAWNIDSKIDDGWPATGKVIVRMWNNNCTTSVSNTDYTGAYKITSTTVNCAFLFRGVL